MSVKFAHIADVHLGYRQYGCEERAVDFAQAFLRAIKLAIDRGVDFILIAGDLFHKKSEMDPLTLTQAIKVLERAKKAKIPVIAVEGNHDSAYFRETFSWLDYLSNEGLLVNLKPSFDDGIVVEEWDGNSGAYIDLDVGETVRIYGMKYYGSMTEKVLEMYAPKIRREGFTIFMAHAGVEGYVNIHGCVPSTRFHRLNVDYVALGHIHRSFVEGKIHNPGSLEVCDVTELGFERGVFIVELSDEGVKAKLERVANRDFVALSFDIDSIEDLGKVRERLEKVKAERPVVYLSIRCPRSVRKMIDEDAVKAFASHLSPIVVKLRWEVFDDSFTPIISKKEDIEGSVISQILESYDYGDICEEVIKLKNAFSTSFDLKKIDEFVEEVLGFRSGELGGSTEAEKVEKVVKERKERVERRAVEPENVEKIHELLTSSPVRTSGKVEKPEKAISLAKLIGLAEDDGAGRGKVTPPNMPSTKIAGESKPESKAVNSKAGEIGSEEEAEEVWDWRRAYDSRGKARKR